MKNILLKRVGAVVLTGMSLFATAGLWGAYSVDTAYAEEMTAQEGNYAVADESVLSPASACVPNKPGIVQNNDGSWYTDYGYFVAYKIRNLDQHATSLWFGKNNSSLRLFEVQRCRVL